MYLDPQAVLRDEDSDIGSPQLVPIPVLITNYRGLRGEASNEERDAGRWQLVRRFFLAEAVTEEPQYAQSMELM